MDSPAASTTTKFIRQMEIARPPVIAVTSPKYAALVMAKGTPDWSNTTLLHEEDDRAWISWLAAHDRLPTNSSLAGPRLWHSHVTLEGAKRGHGVALTNTFIVGDLLRSGELVEIRDKNGVQDVELGAYVFTARTDRWNFSPIARFRSWLKKSVAEYGHRSEL